MTQIHAQVEGDTYFPEDFDLTALRQSQSKSYSKDEKNDYDFTIEYREERKSNGRSIFGFLQSSFYVLSVYIDWNTAFRKSAMDYHCFWLNAFTNLVNSIHAFI